MRWVRCAGRCQLWGQSRRRWCSPCSWNLFSASGEKFLAMVDQMSSYMYCKKLRREYCAIVILAVTKFFVEQADLTTIEMADWACWDWEEEVDRQCTKYRIIEDRSCTICPDQAVVPSFIYLITSSGVSLLWNRCFMCCMTGVCSTRRLAGPAQRSYRKSTCSRPGEGYFIREQMKNVTEQCSSRRVVAAGQPQHKDNCLVVKIYTCWNSQGVSITSLLIIVMVEGSIYYKGMRNNGVTPSSCEGHRHVNDGNTQGVRGGQEAANPWTQQDEYQHALRGRWSPDSPWIDHI